MEDDKPTTNDKAIPDSKEAQINKLELLQDLLLDDYLKQARAGTLSSTDRANLQRWFLANGLELDRTRIPQDLKDKLTSKVRHDADLTEEEAEQKRQLKII